MWRIDSKLLESELVFLKSRSELKDIRTQFLVNILIAGKICLIGITESGGSRVCDLSIFQNLLRKPHLPHLVNHFKSIAVNKLNNKR